MVYTIDNKDKLFNKKEYFSQLNKRRPLAKKQAPCFDYSHHNNISSMQSSLFNWLEHQLRKYNCTELQLYNICVEKDKNKLVVNAGCSYISDINGYIYHPSEMFIYDDGKWYTSLFD